MKKTSSAKGKVSTKDNSNTPKTDATVKMCTKCKTAKPLSEFGKLAASKDGYLTFCKACNRGRNKDYRLHIIDLVGKVVKTKVTKSINWDKVPVRVHEVRLNNDCAIGDFFKNNEVTEDFVLQINVYDKDADGNRKEVSTHRMYVKASDWKDLLSFPQSEQMKSDLAEVTDAKWNDFVFHYLKAFGLACPNNLIGLRFKKHGSTGKCVNIGFGTKNLPALEAKFAK